MRLPMNRTFSRAGSRGSAPTTAEQDTACPGVFHRIRQQVADHLLEKARIAANNQPAGNHAPV